MVNNPYIENGHFQKAEFSEVRSGELLYRIYLTETAEGHARAHGMESTLRA
jgi:hypothetical protein